MRLRATAILLLVAVVILAASSFVVLRLIGAGTKSNNSLEVRVSASHDTILTLRNGGKLVIPAGAMSDGAKVTATYSVAQSGSQVSAIPAGPQVQFSVQPANAIRHPLSLEFPLPYGANPDLAEFGVYAIGFYDATNHGWMQVDTSYAPTDHMLIAQISSLSSEAKSAAGSNEVLLADHVGIEQSNFPSAWDLIVEGGEDAITASHCLEKSGVEPSDATALKFLRCMVQEDAKSKLRGILGKVVAFLTPHDCLSALAIDGLLTTVDTEEWAPVATPIVVLGDIVNNPQCAGSPPPPPVIASISPASGPTAGRNAVTITGAPGTPVYTIHQVLFGTSPAYYSFSVTSQVPANSITVTAPPHAAGTVDVTLVGVDNTSAPSAASKYTYSDPSQPPFPTQTPTTSTSTSSPTPPSPDNPPAYYAGKIVQWNGDTNTPKAAWLVSPDLKRYWIPDGNTYTCLVGKGFTFAGAISSTVLNQLPDQNGQSASCGGSSLGVNQFLFRGSSLTSSNGQYHLELQRSDGNLVLYGPSGALWANSAASDFLILQASDSNLVTYRYGVGATWAANTANTGANTLDVQDDGNLVLYTPGGVAVWDRFSGRLGTAAPASSYAGKIVQWDGDTKTQKTAWLVSPDLKRYWIPDSSTYNCLTSKGFTIAGAISSTVLNQLPDQTGQSASCGASSLNVNQLLFRGTSLTSSNGQYHLELQRSDGNLVLYGPSGALWATSTMSDYLVMQGDGNLVAYRYGVGATWATNTVSTGANTLVVQNDGNLVLYAPGGKPIWDRFSGRLV